HTKPPPPWKPPPPPPWPPPPPPWAAADPAVARTIDVMPTRLSNLNFFISQHRYSSVLRRWCIRGILRCYLRVDPHSLLRDGDSAGSSLMLRGLKWNVYLWSVLAIQSSMAFFPRSVLPRRRRRQHRLRSRKESIAHRANSSRHSIERCENVDRHRISEVKR